MNNIFLIIFVFFIIFLVMLSYFYLLPYLRILKLNQSIRTVGPRNHLKKNGTPTLGGIIICITFLLILVLLLLLQKNTLIYNAFYIDLTLVLVSVLGYFSIGFIDDILIIINKNNNGLKPSLKFFLELCVSIIFYILYIMLNKETKISFFNIEIDLFFLYGPFICLLFTSCTNATNLTDGLDGLLSMSIIPIILGFIFLGVVFSNKIVVITSISMLVSIIIFLFFNFSKAKLFMGDTGSLMIGGYVACMGILLKMPLILLIFCFVFIFETLSVILQVYFFKRTKGSRLFKMSPFHHHLELCGFKEYSISIIYFILSFIFVFIGIIIKLVI